MHSARLRSALFLTALLASFGCAPSAPTPQPAPPVAATPSEAAISDLAVGVRLLEQFRHAEAEARFNKALEATPSWLPAQVNLAIARMNQLEPESAPRAEASARAALALAPRDPRAHYVLGYVLADRAGRFADALEHFRAACELAPDDASSWFQRGRAAEEAGRAAGDASLATEARTAYEKALDLDPKSSEATYRLGRVLLDSDAAGDMARGEALLGEHQRLIAGRPAVQPNYLTRGALALAYPWSPPRQAPKAPVGVTLTPGPPLDLPPATGRVEREGIAVARIRAGLAVADLDGDGRLDLLAPLRDASMPDFATWRVEAGRTFAAAAMTGEPGRACGTAAPGDLDGDGDMDLVLTCSTGNVVLLRDGARWRDVTPREMAFPSVAAFRATLVDVDHDADLDIHAILPLAQIGTGGWAADSLLWRNDGSAGFQQVASAVGIIGPLISEAALWTDVDGDNAVDLIAVLVDGGLSVLHADRDGPFRALPLPLTLAAGSTGPPVVDIEGLDVDGDGDQDVIVLSGGAMTLLVNDSKPGAPAFRATGLAGAATVGTALAVADLDLDGARELLVLAPEEALGTSRGQLLSGEGVQLPVRWIGGEGLDFEVLAPADIDADGAVDLAVRRGSGEPQVLWTTAPAGARWARIALAGREGRSNRQGLGAKLTVDAGASRQAIERRSSRGSACNVVAPEVIGLGGRERIDGLSVLWPSGIQQGETQLAASAEHQVVELDRQPSSCPMLYGWDGSAFRFLTDCFDTAPLGLWVAPGVHWAGDPDEVLRMRAGWVTPIDGVLNLSIAEFLNETLLADRVAMLAIDHEPGRRLVVDEGVRLAAAPPAFTAWLVGEPLPVRARAGGKDVSAILAEQDEDVIGYERALAWTGLAEQHSLELEPPGANGLLVLSGSLNFSNSAALFGAHQAGLAAQPARLEAWRDGTWREALADCGLPAGFHKDVVIDLRGLGLPPSPRLRITTNLQVSWDRAAFHADPFAASADAVRELPLLRAEKRELGILGERKGPDNRWRSFPRESVEGVSRWVRQEGPSTPNGDVRAEVAAADDDVAFVRPGEELLVAFDDAALGPPAQGRVRTHVLSTRGWVKDATPHTAHAGSVLPLPRARSQTYP